MMVPSSRRLVPSAPVAERADGSSVGPDVAAGVAGLTGAATPETGAVGVGAAVAGVRARAKACAIVSSAVRGSFLVVAVAERPVPSLRRVKATLSAKRLL